MGFYPRSLPLSILFFLFLPPVSKRSLVLFATKTNSRNGATVKTVTVRSSPLLRRALLLRRGRAHRPTGRRPDLYCKSLIFKQSQRQLWVTKDCSKRDYKTMSRPSMPWAASESSSHKSGSSASSSAASSLRRLSTSTTSATPSTTSPTLSFDAHSSLSRRQHSLREIQDPIKAIKHAVRHIASFRELSASQQREVSKHFYAVALGGALLGSFGSGHKSNKLKAILPGSSEWTLDWRVSRG